MEAAVTGRRRTTTHAEEEEAGEEEEEDDDQDGEEEEEEDDALVAANPGIAHPALAPFRYLINEQAKSFVVLQELQNEVGALLEFRDLVMETFPHLRQKTGPRLTGGQGKQRDWEPGVRVKRKLHQLHSRDQHDSLAAPRSRSNSHGKGVKGANSSSEAAANSGTSSAGSSAVQDSGFCADSSKEHCSTSATSATSAPRKEADDELWNLLDMIHVKGTRLRLQVEHLQQKLDKHERASPPPAGFRRRSRSLEIISNHKKISDRHPDHQVECRLSLESEMRALKQERNMLLDRIADMEAENLANLARTDRLLAEMGALSAEKRHLERQLRAANAKVASSQRLLVEERSCFAPVTPNDAFVESGVAPLSPSATGDYLKQEDGYRITSSNRPTDPVSHRLSSTTVENRSDAATATPPSGGHRYRASMRLGTLDGIVSTPSPRIKGAKNVTPDKKKIAAILSEFNAVELQRHLLLTTFQNQIANSRIERISRSYVDIHHQLEKFKEENDDLRFQLEEKSIELEGTRARIRLLERLQSAKYSAAAGDVSGGGGGVVETVIGHSNTLLHPSHESTPNPILPQIALPVAVEETNAHHSSSTESAHHDDEEADRDEKRMTDSPKKRPPSKIPLKSYTAPKPPIGRPPHKAPTPPHSHRSNEKLKDTHSSMSLGRSKSRETQSMQPRSRESSSAAAARTASPQAAGSRESLQEPRRTRKTSSNQEASFSSTGSSHSVPRTPHSLKKTPSSSSSRDRDRMAPGADQGEHKKVTSAVVKEPERLEKTEEFLDSLDNGQELSTNCNISTFLKAPFDNQELDRSMSSVAQSRAWPITSNSPQANQSSRFFDSIDNTPSNNLNQSLCLSGREGMAEGMAESDSLEPSCSDCGDLV